MVYFAMLKALFKAKLMQHIMKQTISIHKKYEKGSTTL